MSTEGLQKAHQIREAQRLLGIVPEKLDPLQKAAKNPTSRSLAIRAKCYDCVGQNVDPGWHRRVRECEITSCPLWPFRPT